MKEMNVGVLGATGAVGQEMLKILAERDFPVRSVRPLASARSAGGSTAVKVAVDAVLFVASYFIQKFWVFSQRGKTDGYEE